MSKLLDPASFARNGSEEGHQTALFVWASQHPEIPELRLLFAIPNGGERNKIVATKLKAQGARAGVPDMFLPVSSFGFHGLFIELKRPASEGKAKGRTSNDQNIWIAMLRTKGYAVAVCEGWIEASNCLIEYLFPKRIEINAGQTEAVSRNAAVD